jgi:hypothetical protein
MRRSVLIFTILASVLLAAAVAVVAWRLHLRAAHPSARGELAPDSQAYLSQIAVSNARMSAAKNFLGDSVVYLDADLTNRGTRAVRQVGLRLEFFDVFGELALRDNVRPIPSSAPPLPPGATRHFRLTFEHMPAEWNQAPPAITCTEVRF